MGSIHSLSLTELSKKLSSGEVSSLSVTDALLERIESHTDIGAYLHVCPELARRQANAADKRRQSNNSLGPLDGIPIALKDNFLVKDLPTTCASKILEGFVSPYDGTAVDKLLSAGAVILGKLNQDEFAMGSSTEHSAYQQTKNPWDRHCVPGGSSGGSAAAVAADLAYATLGTDTGGSIRQPASFTGTVGLKPTYGRVSRYGVIAFASSLDQVGPICKTVTDAALLLGQIAGHDSRDSTSSTKEVPNYVAHSTEGVKGLKIGIPAEYISDAVDSDVRNAFNEAKKFYESEGAQFVELSLPHTEYAIPTYYLLATAEASSNLARYDGVRYGARVDPKLGLNEMYAATRGAGFGSEVKRRIILGTYALSSGFYDAYYLKAQKVRTLLRQDFSRAFEHVDFLITPTTPTPAFKCGEKLCDPVQMYLADLFTVSANLAGLPALSIPCGFTPQNLPVGLQLIGNHFDESSLFNAAQLFESNHDFHARRAVP